MFKIEKENDKIRIYTPYNANFVKSMRKLKGKWNEGAWEVRADLIDAVRKIMRENYGRDDLPVKTVNIKVRNTDRLASDYCSGLEMFGRSICYASGRDSGAKIADGVAFIKGGCTSAGSMKNWYTRIEENSEFIIYDLPESALNLENPYKEDIEVEVLEARVNKNELIEEKEILLKRIAEIDELLGGLA